MLSQKRVVFKYLYLLIKQQGKNDTKSPKKHKVKRNKNSSIQH